MKKLFMGFLGSTLIVLLIGCGGNGGTTGGNGTNVVVPDTTPPVITLNGSAVISLNVDDTYIEAGATATDNVDGTVAVVIAGSVNATRAGTYTVTYSVQDSAGNQTQTTRTVMVSATVVPDTTPPVITLNGSAVISLNVNNPYIEAGATATDNVDGTVAVVIKNNISELVNVPSSLTPGQLISVYTFTYSAQDSAGNQTQTTRTIFLFVGDK